MSFTGTIEDVQEQCTRFKSCVYVSTDLSMCYFLAPAVNVFNILRSHMQRHIKRLSLEIHFVYLGNKEIHRIFKTCCIICILF